MLATIKLNTSLFGISYVFIIWSFIDKLSDINTFDELFKFFVLDITGLCYKNMQTTQFCFLNSVS